MIKRCTGQPGPPVQTCAPKNTPERMKCKHLVASQLHFFERRNAGVAEWEKGEDRRQPVFYIPAPSELDFGFCVIDLKKM
jgi:hypothetical protein